MLYAVARINGKQYKLTENQELSVDRLNAKVGQVIDITDILLVSQDDTRLVGDDAAKVKIKAKVTQELLGQKILVFKYKKRKRYRRLIGHRQSLSKLVIESIDFEGKRAEKKQNVEKKTEAKPVTESKAKQEKATEAKVEKSK